jgi:hypothetical protein
MYQCIPQEWEIHLKEGLLVEYPPYGLEVHPGHQSRQLQQLDSRRKGFSAYFYKWML